MQPVTALYAPAVVPDVVATLAPLRRGTGDPTMRLDHSGVWRTLRTPAGPATLHLARSGTAVAATAWGGGAEWAIDGVPELLGHGDDWSELEVSSNALLTESLQRNPGLRLARCRQVFEMLLPAVLEQKVTSKEARQSWRRLLLKYGDPAPGPAPEGMRVFPTSETWRRVPSWEWHKAGVGPQRSETVMRVASVAPSLERTLEDGRGGAVVEAKLRSIIGVGVWTAAETMQRAHGDPDSPSVGDYHLASFVGCALTGSPVDDDGMLELLAPWAGQRQRVVRLLAASGFTVPRRGSRITIHDHRAH